MPTKVPSFFSSCQKWCLYGGWWWIVPILPSCWHLALDSDQWIFWRLFQIEYFSHGGLVSPVSKVSVNVNIAHGSTSPYVRHLDTYFSVSES
jgi:hypothetical protein